ncbi:unnamed protein product [Mytilus edulis]|uniref:C2H2-type domain-containing protein n=1 Tax=Mytilus edulis TaxID=6550 RepID=A0A8S3R829_MYTED|nr:unnamed protein product [Mytilus edulis]
MEGCPILTDIINCFTSTDQLLTFVQAYGLEDDPYVQLRLTHLRQTNPMDFKCTTCGEWLSNQENYEFHMLYHETIQDFDLSLFDDTPPDKNHIEPTINSNKRTTSIPDSCDVYTPPPAKKASFPSDQYGAGDDNPTTHTFHKKRERTYANNGATDITYEVKFSNQLQNKKLTDIVDDLHNVFDDVLDQVRVGSQDNSLARLIIEHNGLTDPIVVPLQELNTMDASTVMDEISKVLQSNEELPVDDSFSVTVGRIDIPSGGGRVYITKLTGDDNSLKRKRSIISRPSDTMCMPMAISVCFLKTCRVVSPREWQTLTSDDTECMVDKVLKHRTTPKWFYNHVLDKGRKECINFAKRLCALADVSTEKQCNINDIERFEKVVDLQILVISSKLGNKFIRVGEGETDRKKVFLYLIEENDCGHFAAIVSISGFFSCSYFCTDCLKPYSVKDQHSCQTHCTVCCSSDCVLTGNSLSCRACNRTCRSIACFQRHIEEKITKKGVSYTDCGKNTSVKLVEKC